MAKIAEKEEIKQKISSSGSGRIKHQLKGKYSELDREVKRMAKADKVAANYSFFLIVKA